MKNSPKNGSRVTSTPVVSVPHAAGGAAVPPPGSAKEAGPEVLERPRRRQFTAEYKQRVLREYEAAKASGEPGAAGAVLRREGLYSSHIVSWRAQRDAGELAGLTPSKRGRKPKRRDPAALEVERLRRENARLADDLRKANVIIDVQKKLSLLLGIELPDPDSDERSR